MLRCARCHTCCMRWFAAGISAVTTFFVLSGFVLASHLCVDGMDRKEPAAIWRQGPRARLSGIRPEPGGSQAHRPDRPHAWQRAFSGGARPAGAGMAGTHPGEFQLEDRFIRSARCLGLIPGSWLAWAQHGSAQFRDYIHERIDARATARKERRFADADLIRTELAEQRVFLVDKPDGTTTWRLP